MFVASQKTAQKPDMGLCLDAAHCLYASIEEQEAWVVWPRLSDA